MVGISAAQQEMPMKKAEKMLKTAEPAKQNLPGEAVLSAGAKEMAPISASLKPDSAPVVAPSMSDTRLQALEQTHDLVAMHAMRLNHSGNEAMRVVIEPVSGTRISVELRMNNGSVEAQAVLHRGDFQFLTQHWSELQQRLEPRGINLGSLEFSNQASTDQRGSQGSGRQPAEEPPLRSAFAEFAFDGSMNSIPSRARSRGKTHPGWETWA